MATENVAPVVCAEGSTLVKPDTRSGLRKGIVNNLSIQVVAANEMD